MEDNIIMKRIWQDADFCEIEIECLSKTIVARSKFYITDFQLNELYN